MLRLSPFHSSLSVSLLVIWKQSGFLHLSNESKINPIISVWHVHTARSLCPQTVQNNHCKKKLYVWKRYTKRGSGHLVIIVSMPNCLDIIATAWWKRTSWPNLEVWRGFAATIRVGYLLGKWSTLTSANQCGDNSNLYGAWKCSIIKYINLKEFLNALFEVWINIFIIYWQLSLFIVGL